MWYLKGIYVVTTIGSTKIMKHEFFIELDYSIESVLLLFCGAVKVLGRTIFARDLYVRSKLDIIIAMHICSYNYKFYKSKENIVSN